MHSNTIEMISSNWLVSALLAFIVFYVINFYIKVYRLPRGPFPLPIIGNLPVILFGKENPIFRVSRLLENYGPITSMWISNTPVIIIKDLEIAKKALLSKQNDFQGRPGFAIKRIITQDNGVGILFSDAGPTWVSLRKVSHTAVSGSQPIIVADVVEEAMDTIKSDIGLNREFDIANYLEIIIAKIMATSAFGERYPKNDSQFSYLLSCLRRFARNFDPLSIADFVPILFATSYRNYIECKSAFGQMQTIIRGFYEKHLTDYRDGIIRDFCDALIYAQKEAISQQNESVAHLNDQNLFLVLFDLFIAGIEATKYTLRWIFLFLANNPEMQERMREEIAKLIGDRIAVEEDKNKCHYTYAFVLEVLRYRNVAPIGIPHKTLCDTVLENYNIPKDAILFAFTYKFMHSPDHWKNPETFDPNRFLTDGKLDSKINPHFLPFGLGKRICLGDKVAENNLFLILVGILQSTANMKFVLPKGPGSADLEPNLKLATMTPKRFKILLTKD